MKTIQKFSLLLIVLLAVSLWISSPALAQGPTPGDLNGDQAVIGTSNFRLVSGQALNGDLAVIGGSAVLEEGSVVNGSIAVLGGTLTISGDVRGDITGVGGVITLTDTAYVHGSLVAPGVVLNKSENAIIEGTVTMTPSGDSLPIAPNIPNINPGNWLKVGIHSVGEILWGLLQVIGAAALALVIALLLPKPLERVAAAVSSQPVISGGIGLLTVILAPLVAILLTITIILIPFTILFAMALAIALFCGWIAVGLELGNRLAKAFKTTWTVPLATGLGTLLLTLVAAMLSWVLSCLSSVFVFLVAIIGLGSVILTRFGVKDYPVSQTARPSTPVTPVVPVPVAQPTVEIIPHDVEMDAPVDTATIPADEPVIPDPASPFKDDESDQS